MMWRSIVELGRLQMTWRMRISCWIPTATNTLSECVAKVKQSPLQAWTGPEGSRMLRFPDFMTTAQDSGKVVRLTHRPPLPPGNGPGTRFC